MSSAFVKEIDGEKWQAPSQAAFQVVWAGDGESDVLREGDNLSELLTWVLQRSQGRFELRRADGTLLGLALLGLVA